ncbi:DUF4179 domain-containing protein [Bacillus altitudinis]|uniref:DUF4179 domain-containing protein n=1 Tax=Bacillus altitudinis TaxID=293387 RepID=UPI0024A8991A|nr:DUF4179 domain-containing protein [Bacillus altitudinis]MDI6648473.1 DUF4179 domain-containing protein [Bacillus altitudinis]MDI6663097.1 DUF4179 domain-containing protein [Bacillus altitudinis]
MERKEMKKLYEEIDVPKVELTSAIRQAMGDVKAEKKRRWFTWNWRTPIYSVIALVVLYFSSGFIFPSLNTAMARVPFVGQLYMMFHDKVGMSLFQSELVKHVNEGAESRGVTVKVSSVYYDAGRLVYTFTVENFHTKEDFIPIKIDSDQINENFQPNIDSPELKKLKDGRYAGRMEFFTNGQTIKQGQKAQLVISKIGDIVGNWRFELPVVKQKTTLLAGQKEVSILNGRYQVKDIKLENGVNSSVIQYAIDYNGVAKDDKILIDRMRDNLGNKYRLETGTRFEEKQLSNKKTRINHMTILNQPIDPKATELTFFTALWVEHEESKIIPLQTKLPIQFKTKHYGIGIKINKIEQKGRSVIVDYQFTGVGQKELDEGVMKNAGEWIGLGDVEKMKSWPDPEVNYENGYYLKANDAKVTNLQTASMQSTFDFDVKELEKLSLNHFSFKDYGLYLDLSNLNMLAPQKEITVTIPVKKETSKASR